MSPFLTVQIIQILVFSPVLALIVVVIQQERINSKLEKGE